MIELRTVSSDADLAAWAALKSAVVPNEPVTAAQLRAAVEPDRILLLAERDGELAGCGIADRSSFGGRAFIAVRVLPQHRRHGVGSTLLRPLTDHARSLGLTGVNAFVYANEPHSIAFAESLGLAEVDYQLEQVRAIGDEPQAEVPAGFDLESLEERREELLEAVWPVALEGYEDTDRKRGCEKRRRDPRARSSPLSAARWSATLGCSTTATARRSPSMASRSCDATAVVAGSRAPSSGRSSGGRRSQTSPSSSRGPRKATSRCRR
jgi:GNAT superfamily N-acetyltransferase